MFIEKLKNDEVCAFIVDSKIFKLTDGNKCTIVFNPNCANPAFILNFEVNSKGEVRYVEFRLSDFVAMKGEYMHLRLEKAWLLYMESRFNKEYKEAFKKECMSVFDKRS